MKKYLLSIVLLTVLLLSNVFGQAEITTRLSDALADASKSGGMVRSLVMFKDQVDIRNLDKQLYATKASLEERAYTVITTLQEKASATQGSLIEYLDNKFIDEVSEYRSFWISNMIYVEATPAVILEIAERSEIAVLDLDAELKWDEPVSQKPASSKSPGGIEAGLAAINAPAMWKLGFTGAGRIVMNDDTGVDGNHPSLSYKWRGAQIGVPASAAWFDPETSTSFPTDGHYHGTHTMGTMCGLDPATNDTIGVAFNAQWIASKTINTSPHTSNSIAAWQWATDPDSNPSTIDDMPDAIGNSWWDPNIPDASQCDATLNPYINAYLGVEAAGIAIIFSAGNSGPSAQTVTSPKNVNIDEVTFWATGAVNGNTVGYPIASFSSRGPVHSSCTTGNTSLDIKPEASAPGVDVRSAQPGTGYQLLSGTSMACPHVVGAIALLREAVPTITGWEAKMALYNTAVDLGDPGEDNTYGMGIIDVYAAYASLADPTDPNPPADFTAYSDYNTPTSMLLNWTDPSAYFNGDPLTNFQIYVYRDGAYVDAVPMGTENYTDTGLTDGQSYDYSIVAADIPNDSTSTPVAASWIAGGAGQPNAPTSLAITDPGSGQLRANWTNPGTNVDGTPLDDFDAINLYENSTLLTTFTRSTTDTGAVDFNDFTPSAGTNQYYVTAVDNESPSNESNPSNISYSPLGLPFFDDFPTAGAPNAGYWLNTDAEVNANGDTPPSPSYALNLNGHPNGADIVELLPVDMAAGSGQGYVLSYWWQPQGLGELPDGSDSLIVEFYNDLGNWVKVWELNGRSNQPFENVVISIDAANAGAGATFFHNSFQIRFRSVGTASSTYVYDDWFVDDVFLGIPNNDPIMVVSPTSVVDTLLVGATANHIVTVSNNQNLPSNLNYTATESPAVGWLDVTPTSGVVTTMNSADLTFAIDATGLSAGPYSTEVIITGDDPANSADTVMVSIQVNDAPTVGATPDSMHFELNSNVIDSMTLTITNSGNGPLYFTLDDEDVNNKFNKKHEVDLSYINPAYQVEIGKDEVDWRKGTSQIESSGGPDLYGYTWIDSDEPGGPTFNWIDISATGTVVSGLSDDNHVGPFPIGFDFNFYGTTQTQFYVQSNGLINFDDSYITLTNYQLPLVDNYNNLIAWLWDDLDPVGSTVYYQNVGNSLVIQFEHYYEYPDGGAWVDAEMILYPGGKIVIQYDYFEPGFDLVGCTIGIENADGTDGLQVAYNGAYLHDGLALVFALDSDWLSTNPTSGTVAPGSQTDVQVIANTDQMFGGDYLANVIIASNDPVTPEYRVPVSLHVVGVPDITAYPSPVDWGTIFTNVNDTMYLTIENIGTDTLHVSSITNSIPEFTIIGSTAFSLLIGETYDLPIVFNSSTPGTFNDSLVITNNSVNHPTLSVGLDGITQDPPIVHVAPTTLSDSLLSGETSTHYFDVWNTGASPLYFEIDIMETVLESNLDNLTSGVLEEGKFKHLPISMNYPRRNETPSTGLDLGNSGTKISHSEPVGNLFKKGSNAWFKGGEYSTYFYGTFDTDTPGTMNEILSPPAWNAYCGDYDAVNTDFFYVNSPDDFNIYTVEAATGIATLLGSTGLSVQLNGMACDKTTNIMYGVDANNLYTIDLTNGAATLVGSIGNAGLMLTLACDGTGTLYGIDLSTDDLWLIDKSTGAGTSIGVLGFDCNYAQSMSWDPESDLIFWAAYGGGLDGNLRVIDPTTGGSTYLGDFENGREVTVLAFPGSAGGGWVSTNPVVDTVAVGDTVQVAVNFDAAGLITGLYEAEIHVNSNDPVTPIETVNASLYVTGVANIAVNPDTLDYGFHYQGAIDTLTFAVENPGTADLTVSSLTTSTSDFTVLTVTPFIVTPGSSNDVDVVFNAGTPGNHADSVVIAHDAPIVVSEVVYLFGVTADPPVMVMSDTLMQHTISVGAEDSSSFWIYNAGVSDLEFEIFESHDVMSKTLIDRSQWGKNFKPTNGLADFHSAPRDNQSGNSGHGTIGTNYSEAIANAFGAEVYNGEFIKFDITSPTNTIVVGSFAEALFAGDFSGDNTFYAVDNNTSNLVTVDTTNGSMVVVGTMTVSTGHTWTGMTFDVSTNTMYASSTDGSISTLYTVDLSTGATTVVGTTTTAPLIIDIACDIYGNMYAHDIGADAIYSLDKATATATLIGSTGINANYAQGMDFDPETNILYLAAYNGGNSHAELREVNLSTGATTLIGDIGAGLSVEVGAFGIPGAIGLDWVDAYPESGTITGGDSLEITVKWYGMVSEDMHNGYLGIFSNDPAHPVENVHLILDVLTGIDDLSEALPTKYALHQNYPNPFNPSTTIKYDLKAKTDVKLTIYNVLGQKVRTLVRANQAAGYKNVVWDGLNDTGEQVSTGVYIYRIEAGDFVKSRKMIFMK